jgi:nicotinate phosphoribosyltransferase
MNIIKSLLTQDFYSFTQMQCILHHFTDVQVEYKFKCRNDVDLTPYKQEIEKEIDHLCTLSFYPSELQFLSSISFLKKNYIDFLKIFRLQRDNVTVSIQEGKLDIQIKGNWFQTILFEVPVLAIVNEIYFKHNSKPDLTIARERLDEKITLVKESNQYDKHLFKFADFGLRRRYSGDWHYEIIKKLKTELSDNFIGTSNVELADCFKVRPIGTMSHQLTMAGQGLPNIRLADSQKYMLDTWVHEFRGDLGIALSDTLGFDAFLRNFDLYFAKLYDGCRHDSGDPYLWCEKLIKHYEKLKIDPRTKTAVFSDGLTFPLALDLHKTFSDRIKTSFGIGTNLTNDCSYVPLQIVMKLISVNGNPVAKVSDSLGKGMCEDTDYLKYLKSVFKID